LEENLTGHYAKYDTSSADLNPIGGMLKSHSRQMLGWIANNYDYPTLNQAAASIPTSETCPLGKGNEIV
jgi:NH3-dependent NAD+ synthetase